MAPKPTKEQTCRKSVAEKDEEYLQKRARNNISVQKSREKSKQKEKESAERADRLRKENTELEGQISKLQREQALLKEMLLSSAVRRKRRHAVRDDAAVENAPRTISADILGEEMPHHDVPLLNDFDTDYLW